MKSTAPESMGTAIEVATSLLSPAKSADKLKQLEELASEVIFFYIYILK
jgi:hypothetical protein